MKTRKIFKIKNHQK